MNDIQHYEKPLMRRLGTVHDLTLQFNKVGTSNDIYTAVTDGGLVGSLIEL